MANHTILLIDYEPRSIERFRQPLTSAGYRVEIATDGIAGVEAFTRLSPDMVLVEAMIPKKHGFEVCQELKRTPHGRRTPIIITTGVYKGRKYRTQALHIYGCDEYIEKPIAAEQLVAIVERFLSGTTPSAREPVAAGVDASEAVSSVSIEPPRATPDSSPARPAPHKPPVPKAMVTDLTEDEIMARLDAILPASSPMASQPDPEPQAVILETLPEETYPVAIAADPEPIVESDPFKQMQAELTAELGSLSGALALDPLPGPESMPSDQAAAPPLLESLPVPEPESIPLAPVEAPLPAPGQVVTFDAKRSRKSKKAGRRPQASAMPAAPAEPPAGHAAPEPRAPREIGIPSGTLVESALGSERTSRGVPAWLWIVGLAIVLVAVYFVFWQGKPGTTKSTSAPETESRAMTVPEPSPEPVASLEPPAPTTSPTTTSTADSEARLVLNAVGPQPSRTAPAVAPPKTSAKRGEAATSVAEWRPSRREQETVPVAPPSAPAGLELGTADAGVESIAEAVPAAAPTPRPATAAGTLVDLSEVDSSPASLSRKLPAYSMQARQLKLQGTVVMKVLVNERGTVDQVVVVSGIDGADLTESTVRAARQWTYRPAVKDGVPVKVWTTEQVTFKI